MDDISTLVWLGIGVVWILTRLIRGGVKKANRELGKRVPQGQQAMPAQRAPIQKKGRFEAAQPYSAEAGNPKPIEPR